MTLNCIVYNSNLTERLSSCTVVHSLNQALRLFRNGADEYHSKDPFKIFPYVMRVYNSACSFWIGFDLNGALLIEHSRADFKRSRLSSGGVEM